MPIRFHISWYHGDPIYTATAPDCALLVSPTSFSSRWTIRQFEHLPSRLIVDSGGFRYLMSDDQPPTVQALLERQIQIVNGTQIPTLFCALDLPLAPGPQVPHRVDYHIARTLAHAYELQRIVHRTPLASNIELMAVVQGNDIASLSYCARELKAMGYENFGIGSLARVWDAAEISARVAAVYSILQRPLHLFGIGSPQVLNGIDARWVDSVDSSSPAKAAACNEIFYSRPFRRFGIMTSDGISRSKFPTKRCLSKALQCECTVCKADPEAIMQIGQRDHIRARAIHNYFHLRTAIEGSSEKLPKNRTLLH